MSSRTQKRSRSGAHIPCPECGKRVRTVKGLAMHQAEMHPEPTEANPDLDARLMRSVAQAIGQANQ